MVQITNLDVKTFSIHTLQLKLWLFKVCIGSHSLARFAHKKVYGSAGYVDDPLPNMHIAIWVPACIVWLYYARLCGGFRTIFSA